MKLRLSFRHIAIGCSVPVIVIAMVAALGQSFATQAAAQNQLLANSIVPAISQASQIGRLSEAQNLAVTFTLRPRNQPGLERLVRDIATPHSPHFHAYLTPANFALAFGPDPKQVQRVELFAQQAGLRLVKVQSGGMFISVSGTAQQLEQAFHIQLGTYRDTKGNTFFANDRALSLPAAILPTVATVTGLDSRALRQQNAKGPRSLSRDHMRPHDNSTTSCPATTGTFGLTPPQLQTAYGFPTNANGAGSRMALVEFDGYVPADISAFTTCFASSVNVATTVKSRLVDMSTPLPAGPGAIEDELDIELALGMAPGLSGVDVYEAPNTNQGLVDMMAAIANDDSDATVSDSWGACEADTGFGVAFSEELAFLQMAAQGQGTYVAAGDTGAYDCFGDLPNSTAHSQSVAIDDPASDPYVTAVGGTSLVLNATTSNYISEMAWNDLGLSIPSATGGGLSQFWASPSWQLTAKATNSSGGIADAAGMRAIPDLAADADPQTGYAMYCTAGSICAGYTGWIDIGGTSAAAPLWAALGAIANQLTGARVGLITPALYQLYGADTAATSPAGIAVGSQTYYDYGTQKNGSSVGAGCCVVFNDVTQGNNSFATFPTGFNAQSGYDATTGLGTMVAASVANYLVNQVRFTAPRLYMVAKGSNNGYWLSGYFMNTGNNNAVTDGLTASNWLSLGGQTFQGAPGVADNNVTTVALSGTTALVWIAGVGNDGTVRFGSWNPGKMLFSGWTSVPGTTCKGDMASAFVQGTLFLSCMTPAGAVVLNAYNPQFGTWGGWATVGGGLTTPPTMGSDGTNLLLVAQAPTGHGDTSVWFSFYTPGSAAQTPWRRFMTTCQATPAVAYNGAADGTYTLACIANDTSTMWSNTLSTSDASLSYWTNLGAPAATGLKNGTAVTADLADDPGVLFFSSQGKNNASYVQVQSTNPLFSNSTGWQVTSLPGIFSSNAGTDYFGV